MTWAEASSSEDLTGPDPFGSAGSGTARCGRRPAAGRRGRGRAGPVARRRAHRSGGLGLGGGELADALRGTTGTTGTAGTTGTTGTTGEGRVPGWARWAG